MFTDAFELTLKLTHKGGTVSVPGGDIKVWDLDLHAWGFRGKAEFIISLEREKDELFDVFTTPELLTIELSIAPYFQPLGDTVEPLKVKGLSTRKAILVEQTLRQGPLNDNPLLYRMYEVEFADPAQVVWGWHRPFDLMVDKSVRDLLMAHKSSKVDLRCEWKPLDQVCPVLCLALGMEAGGASFYDFVLWYVDTNNGVFTFDPAANSYTLAAEKRTEGKVKAVSRQWVESVRIDFPQPARYSVRVLNGFSETPGQHQIDNQQNVDGVYYDCLGRYPVAADFERRQQMERDRLITRGHELRLVFSQYPSMTWTTGSLIKLEGDLWGDKLSTKGKEYRVRSIHIQARAVDQEPTADHNLPENRFTLAMHSCLELREEKWVSLPTFTAPRYPVLVEGKVVSEQGEEQAQTYQIYEDTQTSLPQYKVTIPLWNNQVVVAPFAPILHSGHFYFPAYKDARALVALDFQKARIVQWLDWRDEARLPADTQGNRILMGWTPSSRTAISHTYVNNLPVFALERRADNDSESITLSDGNLVIQTRETKE